MRFNSLKEKKIHKEKYPNGSCIELEGGNEEMVKEAKEKVEELGEEVMPKEDEKKETLKEIPKIKEPKEQAKEEWKKYCEVLKKRKEKYLRVMKDAHYQMKEGRELIDVYNIMKHAGLNENNEPRLAIARADLKTVYFIKQDEGAGFFSSESSNWNESKNNVGLPQNTFKVHWERRTEDDNSSWNIKDKTIQTKVPIVPIELLPEGDLSNYYILWETSDWEVLPETKDPILLKRISENLFAILGSWDLTELEQSIIAGGKY